jgi:hypothetical protein
VEQEIWTYGYYPFSMGGRTWRPIKAKVPVKGPFPIGMGLAAWVAESPKGKTCVVETTSHAIVGPDLETVRADVALGDSETMWEQIRKGMEEYAVATPLEPAELWHLLRA